METETKARQAPVNKLNEEHKELVILRLAEFTGVQDIVVELKQAYSIDISEQGVYWYVTNHKPQIKEKREDLNIHLQDNYALANKAYRFRVLQDNLKHLEPFKDLDSLEEKRKLVHEAQDLAEPRKVDVTQRPAERVLTDDELKKETEELSKRYINVTGNSTDTGEDADILAEDKTEEQGET